MHRLFGEPKPGPAPGDGDHGALPDAAQQVVDPLGVPGQPVHAVAVRGGPDDLDEPPGDAAAIGVKDNDWIEAPTQRRGSPDGPSCRTGCPRGRHTSTTPKDRTIDVPLTETGRRGIHNSLTRLLVKPSHLIGGYAQLSYAFNYLGPTGNQRDIVSTIRRRSQEVTY